MIENLFILNDKWLNFHKKNLAATDDISTMIISDDPFSISHRILLILFLRSFNQE